MGNIIVLSDRKRVVLHERKRETKVDSFCSIVKDRAETKE